MRKIRTDETHADWSKKGVYVQRVDVIGEDGKTIITLSVNHVVHVGDKIVVGFEREELVT